MSKSSLDVVILAAGQGKRMRSSRPKVLHEIAGRSMLGRVIDVARSLGPDRLHVVYGHGGGAIRQALADEPVNWVLQAEQLGTGHAVGQAAGAFGGGIVLILYGDVPAISADTLAGIVGGVGENALVLLTVEVPDATGYGRILRRADGSITGIVEEKDATCAEREVREINTGIMACGARRLAGWLDRLDNDNAQGEYYLTDIVGLAVHEQAVVTAAHPGEFEEVLGVNDCAQLAVLERYWQRRAVRELMAQGATIRDPERVDIRGSVDVGPDVVIDVNVVFEGTVSLGEGVSIGPNNVIRDASIGPGSEILANCVIEEARTGAGCRIGPFSRLRPGADLGDSVHIGNFVEVKKSTIGEASKINHLTYVGDAEIGRNVNVGAGTITCNYDGANKHQTVIGDDAFIGSGVELVAPVAVGPGATIGAGSTIGRDAPAGELTLERARQKTVNGWRRPTKSNKTS